MTNFTAKTQKDLTNKKTITSGKAKNMTDMEGETRIKKVKLVWVPIVDCKSK